MIHVLGRYAEVRGSVTMREFAEREGIPYWTFHEWLYGFRRVAEKVGPSRRRRAADDGEVRMIPVRIGDESSVGGSGVVVAGAGAPAAKPMSCGGFVEAELPAGVKLRFTEGTTAAYVASLVQALVGGEGC